MKRRGGSTSVKCAKVVCSIVLCLALALSSTDRGDLGNDGQGWVREEEVVCERILSWIGANRIVDHWCEEHSDYLR